MSCSSLLLVRHFLPTAAVAFPLLMAAVPLTAALACFARAGATAPAVGTAAQQPVPWMQAATSPLERLVITIYDAGAGSMRTPPTARRSSTMCSACRRRRRRRRPFLGRLVPGVVARARLTWGGCGWRTVMALVGCSSFVAREASRLGVGWTWFAAPLLLLPSVLVVLVVASLPTRPAPLVPWRGLPFAGLPRSPPWPLLRTGTLPIRDPIAAACGEEEGRKELGTRRKGPTRGGRGGTVADIG